MPQSLSCLLIHLVFSTKNRRKSIDAGIELELHRYMAGICERLECPVRAIGGTEDHVHVLCSFSRTKSVAEIVEKLKANSSRWIKVKGSAYHDFAWQSGYGAFAIGRSAEPAMKKYIARQKEHHRKTSFEDEFRRMLAKYQVPFDERYVWD
ncbi:MAG: IS200/IS605 family transposase [Planctomycetota bacterium]|nr:IS200/IS605 family transposase [Planctomycetota bacterium]